jgi:hypothetical protein
MFKKMVQRRWFVCLTCWIAAAGFAGNPEGRVKFLKRSESFLGIHFDFHAGDDCTEIGKNVDLESVEFILDQVRPDYVQCDSKGHPGISSYPTRIGNPAPGFVRDPLKIWREATQKRGVALFVHHSGVLDEKAVAVHPDWGCADEGGGIDPRTTSVFGPYADSLLIPQLEEMSNGYGVNGAWVDGECWGTKRDWSPRALEAFRAATGIREIPRKPFDPHWYEFTEFCRDGFRKYLRHVADAVHAYNPDFQFASNWAFSSMMPEPVSADVDFISGDFSASNSVNSARFEGRCMVHQGKPWDLMAWSFTWKDGLYSTKSVPQLEQEAAVVLALGGGFQAYFPQKRDASVRKWQMGLMKETASFCRARQAVCHRAEPVPQIGLIYSGRAFYREAANLFNGWGGELVPLRGILQSLLEAQCVVDIVMEHHLAGRMREYPLLVYPEWKTIEPEFKSQLLAYVEAGGNLLVVGPAAAGLFEDVLDVRFEGEPAVRVNGLEHGGWIAGIKSEFRKCVPGRTAEPFGGTYPDNDFSENPGVAATVTALGRGKIAAVYLNLGERFLNSSTSVSRDFLAALVKKLMPEPVVEVNGSHFVDVSLNRKEGRLIVNLVNTAGPHADEKINVFDAIPEVGPLEVSVRFPKKPVAVTLEPDHRKVSYRYGEGMIRTQIDRLKIHEALVIQ